MWTTVTSDLAIGQGQVGSVTVFDASLTFSDLSSSQFISGTVPPAVGFFQTKTRVTLLSRALVSSLNLRFMKSYGHWTRRDRSKLTWLELSQEPKMGRTMVQ